jgi:transcriptional regulator with XRE-family HTH domain
MTGAELAALRRAAGLSQSDLARRAGCGRHAVSYWECKRLLDRNAWAVKRMAEALGLPIFVAPIRARAGWGERLDAETEARAAAFAAQVQRWEAARAEMASRRRVRCGALTRKGASCRALSVPGKRRCKFHGACLPAREHLRASNESAMLSGAAGHAGGQNRGTRTKTNRNRRKGSGYF